VHQPTFVLECSRRLIACWAEQDWARCVEWGESGKLMALGLLSTAFLQIGKDGRNTNAAAGRHSEGMQRSNG
jgi:hypothetical protein